MLKQSDAVKIYELKLTLRLEQQDTSGLKPLSLRGQSVPVSKTFGVSSRVVRDIWNRRTWAFVTKPLWSQELAWKSKKEESELETSVSIKTDEGKLGRSKGSRHKSKLVSRSENKVIGPTATADIPAASMFSAGQIDRAISWLDALRFSAKSDPFHNDWPYW